MGQYHYAVNLDRREFVHPHQLGDGLKLWEQAASGEGGVGSALIVLLAVSSGRGGGDFRDDDPHGVIGRWGGDRVAIIGDYAEDGDLPAEFEASKIYEQCGKPGGFTNITASVRALLAEELDGITVYGEGEGWISRRTKEQVAR